MTEIEKLLEKQFYEYAHGWNDKGLLRDYQRELEDIPFEEIERYLRKKKLERIKN